MLPLAAVGVAHGRDQLAHLDFAAGFGHGVDAGRHVRALVEKAQFSDPRTTDVIRRTTVFRSTRTTSPG